MPNVNTIVYYSSIHKYKPRWPPQNRPYVATSKPATVQTFGTRFSTPSRLGQASAFCCPDFKVPHLMTPRPDLVVSVESVLCFPSRLWKSSRKCSRRGGGIRRTAKALRGVLCDCGFHNRQSRNQSSHFSASRRRSPPSLRPRYPRSSTWEG